MSSTLSVLAAYTRWSPGDRATVRHSSPDRFRLGDFITIGCYALIVPSTDVTARMLIGAWSWPVLIPWICLIVVVIALLTDVLVFRPLRRAYSPTLMIASFAVSYIIQNGVLMIYGSRPKAVNLWSELNTQILIGGLRLPLLQIVTIAVADVRCDARPDTFSQAHAYRHTDAGVRRGFSHGAVSRGAGQRGDRARVCDQRHACRGRFPALSHAVGVSQPCDGRAAGLVCISSRL